MSSAPKAAHLSAKQLGLLHVAKRELHLTDADYRAILQKIASVESAGDLGLASFEAVVAHMRDLGFQPRPSKRNYGHRAGMANPGQIALIRKLWSEYHQGDDKTDIALNAWLTRFHHVSALRFVTAEAAGRIIPGLRAMAARSRGD